MMLENSLGLFVSVFPSMEEALLEKALHFADINSSQTNHFVIGNYFISIKKIKATSKTEIKALAGHN